MEFRPWTTDYDLARKGLGKRNVPDYNEFYRQRRRELQQYGTIPLRLDAEGTWVEDGRPYYNIHPKIVPKLCKVNLEKIPSPMLRMPHGVRAVNLRFAEAHPEFTIQENLHTDNRTSTGSRSGKIPAGSYVTGILMVDYRHESGLKIKDGKFIGQQDYGVMFILDYNQFTEYNQPIYSIFYIVPEEGVSLQEKITETERKHRRGKSYEAVIENALKLAVSVGFLTDNPNICEVDILSKYRNEYPRANEARRKQIETNSLRRKNGYNIGTDLMFLGKRGLLTQPRTGEGDGKELEYAHIREGHPHAVRYGPGKELVKIMWFVPTVVRPDLPFKEDKP